MAFTLSLVEQVTNGGDTIKQEQIFSNTYRKSVDESIATGQTDYLVSFELTVAKCVAIFVKSDQDVTLETNSGSSPTNTIALKANIPYVWYTNKYDSLKFTSDVTKIYITNASGSTARLQIEALVDAT